MTTLISQQTAWARMQAAEPVTPRATLTIGGISQPTAALSLTIDRDGQDYLTLDATIPGRLDASLDARLAPPAILTEWLEFPDRAEQTSTISRTLYLRQAKYARHLSTAQTVLTMQGAESLVRDDAAKISRVFTASSTVLAALTALIRAVIPDAPITSTIPAQTLFLTGTDTLVWEPTAQPWGLVTQICDAAIGTTCECFYDGTGFIIQPTPGMADPAYYFMTGSNIVSFEETTSRDDFYNAAQVPKTDGTTVLVESPDPTFGVDAAGRRLKKLTTAVSASTQLAQARGAALISRAIQTGREAVLTTPDLLIGIPIGATVQVSIDGTAENWIIQKTVQDYAAASSTITLRKEL